MQAACLEGSCQVTQLHLGGGTPTSCHTTRCASSSRRCASTSRWCPTANDRIDPAQGRLRHRKLLAELGFNRMSVGVQDFAEDVQQAVNRIQSSTRPSW